MNFRCLDIRIDEIDIADETFRITTERSIDLLMASIKRIGLLQPPIVQAKGDSFRILSGFKRVKASIETGHSRIPVRVVGDSATLLDCARIAIAENTLHRRLNIVEEARIYRLLKSVLKEDDDLIRETSGMGLASNINYINKMLFVCNLDRETESALLEGAISPETAKMLKNLEQGESSALLKVFKNLKLGLNKQRQILEIIGEISKKEKLEVSNLLENAEEELNLSDPSMDRGLLRKRFLDWLQDRRFPEIRKAERRFEEKIRGLGLGKGIKIIPPRFFEGKNYKISLYAESARQLESRLALLGNKLQQPGFSSIFEI